MKSQTSPRLLLSALFLTLTVACTERSPNPSVEETTPSALAQATPPVLAEERSADPATTTDGLIENRSARRVDVQLDPLRMRDGSRRLITKVVDPAEAERQFSRIGEIDLTLPEGPPTADPIEPGRYILSIVIQLSNGSFTRNQSVCRVQVQGPKVAMLLENSSTDPILGLLEDGEFFSEPREGKGTYGLEGRVVGPGKIRGMVVPGPVDHPTIGIVEGRWGLDIVTE